jgi:hypothetical protein
VELVLEGGAPRWILINHDDYAAKHIGRTSNGNQFFLTTPFLPAVGTNPGCEFIALFIFDNNGVLLEAKIDKLGPRSEVDRVAANTKYDQRLAELGKVTFEQIKVEPFEIERFGIKFGLILQSREDEDGSWVVELRPGNYMAFFPPWDGYYDT